MRDVSLYSSLQSPSGSSLALAYTLLLQVTPLISPTPPQDGSGFSKLHVMEDVNGEVQELELVVREGSITPHQHQHQLQGEGGREGRERGREH